MTEIVGLAKHVEFVALSKAKSGGPCDDCEWHIDREQPIFKYADGRKWVCFWCAVSRETHEDGPERLFP